MSAVVWSGAGTGVRLICGFLSIKVTAVYLGPAGLALVGQVGNFVTVLQSTLGNAVNSAVVKIFSEASSDDRPRAAAVVGTALRFLVVTGMATGAVMALAHRPIAAWLLDDTSFSPAIFVLAAFFPIILLGQLALALFTAQRRFEMVALSNIIGLVVATVTFVGLCRVFGLWGGLIGSVLTYSVYFFVAQLLGRREEPTRLLSYWRQANSQQLRPILSFYPMLLANSLSLPLSMLLIRDMLIGNFGTTQAGLWQASVRLSDIYTMIFIGALSMYALPTLSAARDNIAFRSVLRRLVLVCLSGAACAAAVMYFAREFIVRIVFTTAFSPVQDLWPWRLVGDVFLVAGWSMRSALMARGRQIAYVMIEAGIGIGLFSVTKFLMASKGIDAANLAHALVWGVAFICLGVLNREVLFGRAVHRV
jgi:PST family polysaccharide transporter